MQNKENSENSKPQSTGISLKANKEYQDSVFSKFFNQPEICLHVYRELNPQDTTVQLEDITICTLENELTYGIYNDAAFLVKDKLIVLLEHQSTINMNMPVRCLLYLPEEYQRWFGLSTLDVNDSNLSKDEFRSLKARRNIYKTQQIQLPKPEFYVVYTGDTNWNTDELKLSDAFTSSNDNNSIELIVKIIKNTEDKSRLPEDGVLQGYLHFIKRYKSLLNSGRTVEDAVRLLQKEIKSKELQSFLNTRVEEVVNMLSSEHMIEFQQEVLKSEAQAQGLAEGMAQGMAQGREKGRAEGIIFAFLLQGLNPSEIAKKLEEFLKVDYNQAMELVVNYQNEQDEYH